MEKKTITLNFAATFDFFFLLLREFDLINMTDKKN